MPGIEWVSTLDNSAFIRSTNEMQAQIRQTKAVVEAMGLNGDKALRSLQSASEGLVGTLREIGAVAGVAFSVQQAKSFVDKIVETRGYFQDIESSMKVFLGNEEKAKQFTDKLKDYAYYNMFEFSDLATASKQMIAYGHNVESIIPRLDQLSNVARGTSAPLMEMVNAYNRAKNLGGLNARDMQSWAAKGLVVKDILRDMGETIKNNRVTFEQLNRVLDHVTGEGGMFHDLMGEQLNNITAEQGQLEDNLTAMYNEIGEKYQDVITGVIKAESFLVDHYKEIATTIGTLIAAYGEYRVVLMATNAIRSAQQTVLYKKEVEGLDEAIKKYRTLLPEKEKAKNADLAEAVAKKQLTEEQAKNIAAKRDELLSLQVDKETLDITQREAEARRLLLDIDLQDKVATKELNLAQAESIQKRREELAVIEKQVAARKEEALQKVENKISLNERDMGDYAKTNERLGRDKDKYSKKISDIDKNIINLSNDEVKNAAKINALKRERQEYEEKIQKADERIKENLQKTYDLDSENVRLAKEQLDIQIRYASSEEKLALLEEKRSDLKLSLADAKDDAEVADKMLATAKQHHEITQANAAASKERLDGLKEELAREQEINNERSKQGQMYKDLSALQAEVGQAESDYNAAAIQEAIDAKEEDAAASLAQEAAEKVKNVQQELDNVNTQIGTTVTDLNSKEKIKNIMATEGLSTAEKIHAISTTQANFATKIFNVALLQMRSALDAVKVAIMTNPIGVLVGALTIALPLLYQFISGTDDVAEKTERYKNEAAEASEKVKSLVNIMHTADKNSKVYKDSVSQLERIYKEYGIEIDKVKDAQGKEITNTQTLIEKHSELLDILQQEAIERQKYSDMDEAAKEYESNKEEEKKSFTKNLDNEKFSESDKNAALLLVDEQAIQKAAEELQKYNEVIERLKKEYGDQAYNQKEAREQLQKYQNAVSESTSKAREFARNTTDDKDALSEFDEEIEDFVINVSSYKKTQLEANKAAEEAALKVWKVSEAQDDAARSARYAKMSATQLKDELKHIVAAYGNTKLNIDIIYNEVDVPEWMKKKSLEQLRKDAATYTKLTRAAATSKSGKAEMNGKVYTEEEAATRATQANKALKQKEEEKEAADAEKRRKQEEAERNADKNGKDAANRRQKRSEKEMKDLEEQFKNEQERRRSISELRIAQIENSAVKEQEAQKEAIRQKWEGVASQELSAYTQLYDDAKKQFDLTNKNDKKVFADTAEAQQIMDGIRAYVDYYSQRNNLARTANEELEKTNGGIKVFDEAKLDTSKEKLAGLLEMLKGIQDKKVVVESETKDMTKVEVTGDVDDIKAIKQMASEDTSFTVTMNVEQIGSIEIPKDKTFTVTGRYEGADLADIAKKVDSLPKTAETVINTSLGKIQKADINENATVEVETVVDSKQYDELVKKLGKDAVQKVTTEVTGDEIPTVEDKTMAVRIRVDKSKIDDLKKSVPSEMPVKIYSDAKDFKMPKIKDNVTVDVNYEVNSEELDKVKHPKGGTITYNTDVKGLDTIEKLGDKNVKITATVDTDKVQNFSQAVAAVPIEKIVTIGIEQVGELPQVEDKLFTVHAVYDGKEVKDGLAEIPTEANIKVSTTIDDIPAIKDGEMEITAHVTDDEYQELVRKYGEDIVQKVTLDTTDVKTGMQAVQGLDGKTVAIAIKTTGENLQTIANDVKALDTDATLTYHVNADELPQLKGNEVVEVEYKANTEQIKASEEKLKQNPTTTITYNVVTKGYEYVERINNLPTEKTVTIRAEQIGKVEIPDVEDKAFTVTGHYDGSETDKIKEIPSKADIFVTTKVDSKQYDDLAKRFKGNVSILVDVNDKKALEQLQGIKNLHVDPKEVVFRADNKDALQAAKEIQSVHIDEQTMKVYADTEEAMKKLTAMDGMTLQPKTLSVTADTKKAKNDLMAVDGLVKDKKMSVAIKTTGDKLPEVKGDDTVTYTYKANTKELEEVTPPQDATITYTVKVQGKEALQGLKVPADQTYTVTMALEKVGSIEMPKDGTFTISAHLQGEEELKKITELPKEADVTINTKLGDIKKPDIPTDATIEVTTEVSAANYEKLKAQLGEDAVQIIHTKVEGDAVPQVKDQTMTVYVKTDKTGLTNLQDVVGKDVTAKVNTKAGKVNLPKIDKNATVDVKYNVDSTQIDEAAAKLHDGTVTYHVNVEGKEQLDALGDKSISIRVDASREAQAQAKLLGEAFKQSVISAQQLSDAGLDKSFIDKLKNGTYSADELARAIVLLQNAIDGLDKNSEKYKGLYNSLDDDTKAILKNKEALQSANDANTDRERQKKRLEDMRQYFEQYGSLEQKRQAIIEKFEDDIKKSRQAGLEGQALIFEEQLKEKKAQMSIENITKGIDWSSLFNGIGTMSKEMMKQTRQQLQAYMKSDQFRNSGAENQEKVVELMNQIKQYLGSEDVGWRGLGDAMVDFNSAVVALEQAQAKQEAVLAEYLKAKQAKDEAVEKKENGTISEEAYNAAIDAYNEATNKFNEAGKAVKDAQDSVQSFGNKLNAASDGVVNFVSKLDVQLKEMEGIWGRFSGFSDLQKASQDFSSLSGQLGKAAAEEQAKRLEKAEIPEGAIFDDGMGNVIDPNVMKEAFAEPAGGIENALGKLSNITSGIGDVMGEGLSSLLGSAGSMVAGILALPSLIVQAANAIKSIITGILDGISEFLRLEWLSDLIASILDSVANLIDAILDLPESIAKCLEKIVMSVGSTLDSIVGRVSSVFGIAGNPSDWFTNSNEDEVRKKDEELIKANENLDKSIQLLTEEMEKARGGTAAKNAHDLIKLQKEYNSNIMERFKNDMGYHSAHHSNAYYYDLSPSSVSQINEALKEYAEKSGQAVASSINNTWESLTYLTPEEMDYIRKWASGAWGNVKGEGEYEWVYDALEEYADQAGKISEVTKKLYENLTQTTSDDIFNQLLESCINFANGAEDAFDDVAENFQKMVNKMVISNVLGEKMKKELTEWFNDVGKLQDEYYGESAKDAQEEILKNNAQIQSLQQQLDNGDWNLWNLGEFHDIVNEINRLAAKNKELEKEANQQGISDDEYNRRMDEETQKYLDITEKYQKRTQDLVDHGLGGVGDAISNSTKGQQSATFNSAKNITYEQADSLVGIATAQQIILEQIKAWLYKQETLTPTVSVAPSEAEVDMSTVGVFDYSYLDTIIALLQQESGADIANASEAMLRAAQQQIDVAFGREEGIDSSLVDDFKEQYGKLLVKAKDIAAANGMNIPSSSLQGYVPQETLDNIAVSDEIHELFGIIGQAMKERPLEGTESAESADLTTMLTNNSIYNEQNAAQVALISQNLQAMKDITSSNGTIISEIRQLVWDGNNMRESMYKAMKEHFENFDSKMNRVINEIQDM